MSLATVASVIGIGAGGLSLYNSFKGGSGGGSGGTGPAAYVPTGLGEADQSWQDMLKTYIENTKKQGGQVAPILQQAYDKMVGIDTSGLTGAADKAGAQYGALSDQAGQFSKLMQDQAGVAGGAQKNLLDAGNKVFQTSLDPQNALRDMLQQRVVDANRAGTSARGIGMGGEAVGSENDAIRNFMLQWENAQLGRQVQGAGALAGASDSAGRQGAQMGQDLTASLGFSQAAPSFTLAAGETPFNAKVQAATLPFNATNLFTQGMNTGVNQPSIAGMGQIIPYLNNGLGATNQAFGQQQTGLNNFTTGLDQLAKSPWLKNYFGGIGSPGSGSSDPPSTSDQGNPYFPYGGGP